MPHSDQVKDKTSEIKRLRFELTAQSEKLVAAEEALARAELSMARAESRASEQASRLLELDRLVADQKRALSRAESDKKALRAALDRSNATIGRLRNSVSWRVTLPIRAGARAALGVYEWARASARRITHTRDSDVRLIVKSGLFDREYYLSEYPGVARSGIDPIIHFLETGAKEGKNPNPYFDTVYYARQMDGPRGRRAEGGD